MKDLYKPSEEKKDYHCLRCKSQYTTLEVLDSVGPLGFICHKCGNILEERDDRNAGISTGHEKQSKLATQLSKLLKLLQQIDSEDIPKNDFEAAFAVAVPVQRDELINPIRVTEPLQSSRGPPTAVKGNTDNATVPLEISVTTNSERSKAEQAAAAKRKSDLAAQNILPVWHTNSTVTGETNALGLKQQEQERERLLNDHPAEILKIDEDEKKNSTVLNDELAAYYAQIQQENAKEADESSDGGDDDEEDDFEDVGITASAAVTPSSSRSTPAGGGKNGVTAQRKPPAQESVSSASGTALSTPAASGVILLEEDEGRAAKRIKTEERENGTAEAGNADSDEDDEGFEDAL